MQRGRGYRNQRGPRDLESAFRGTGMDLLFGLRASSGIDSIIRGVTGPGFFFEESDELPRHFDHAGSGSGCFFHETTSTESSSHPNHPSHFVTSGYTTTTRSCRNGGTSYTQTVTSYTDENGVTTTHTYSNFPGQANQQLEVGSNKRNNRLGFNNSAASSSNPSTSNKSRGGIFPSFARKSQR